MGMTPENRAQQVWDNATGPISISRYACNSLREQIAEAIRAAVAEEREACAKTAEALHVGWTSDKGERMFLYKVDLAVAIRARTA